MERMLLSGVWKLRGTDGKGAAIDIPVRVPGYVHRALEEKGLIPQMYWRDNAEKCQWPETKKWIFERTFIVPEECDLSRARLRFEGVDTFADILLNGQKIYTTGNAFLSFEVQAGSAIRHGENHLAVVFHPFLEMVKGKKEYPVAFGAWERAHIRRSQCTFYWDWVNRFVSAGICRDVYLEMPCEAEFDKVFAETVSICDTSAMLHVRIDTKNAKNTGCSFSVEIEDPQGNQVWEEHGRVFLHSMRLMAGVRKPQLWWPAGYGKQPLYKVTYRLFDRNGIEIDSRVQRIGIRTVAIETLRDLPGSEEEARSAEIRKISGVPQDIPLHPGESFALLVNGVRIFGKGGNWVPPSPFSDGTDDYRRLISMAAKAHLNLLRVWGGGVYEPDEFYELCDEMGVMLTHDFMLSCGTYPSDDEEFKDTLRREVYAQVARLRHHACIAFWSGNNENCDGYDWDDPNTRDINLVDEVFQPVIDQLDARRVFRPGNPYGGWHNDDPAVGECHNGWWWMEGAMNIEPDQFLVTSRFSAENPYAGYPMKSTLKKFLSEEDLACVEESPVAEYHIKNNPYFTEVLNWPSVHGRLIVNSEILLGKAEALSDRLYRYAYIEYEWARLVVEGVRKNKWYSSAIQFWMFNDCWPALSYSAVDFFGKPKGGWFAMKRACAPVAGTVHEIGGQLVLTCLNDSLKERRLTARVVKAQADTGKTEVILEKEFVSKANENVDIARLPLPEEKNALVFLDILEDGQRVDRARWHRRWLRDVEFMPAEVVYWVNWAEKTVSLHCTQGVAIGAAVDGEMIPEDGFIDLLPGETATIRFEELEGFDGVEVMLYQGAVIAE